MSSDPNKQSSDVDMTKDRVWSISSRVARIGGIMMMIGVPIVAVGMPADIPEWLLGYSFYAAIAGLILFIVGTAISDSRAVSLSSSEVRAALEAQKANEPSFLRQLFKLIFG